MALEQLKTEYSKVRDSVVMGGGDGGMKVLPTSVTEARSGGSQEHSFKQPWILLVGLLWSPFLIPPSTTVAI